MQNAIRLIKAAKLLGVPITVSEHCSSALGHSVASLRRELGADAATFEKTHFSCLREESLRTLFEDIRDTGRGQVIVAGMETHVCVTQTALDMIADGFELFIVADAVGSRTAARRDLAIARLRQAGAHIVESEMVIFEWLEKAGTAEFRELLPLIK